MRIVANVLDKFNTVEPVIVTSLASPREGRRSHQHRLLSGKQVLSINL